MLLGRAGLSPLLGVAYSPNVGGWAFSELPGYKKSQGCIKTPALHLFGTKVQGSL